MLKRAIEPSSAIGVGGENSVSAADGSHASVLKYVGVVRRRGPMVVGFGVIAGLLGAIYALQLVPVYQATATLLLDTSQNNTFSLDPSGNYGMNFYDDGKIESELAIISSTGVARRVVAKLKIDQTPPETVEPSATALILDRLKSLLWGIQKEPEAPVEVSTDPVDKLVRQVQGGVSVKRKGFSYLIAVSYTSSNRFKAAQMANAFADEYLVDQLESRFESTRRANDWLSERLSDLRTKVQAAERAVEVFKSEHNIIDTQGSTLGDQQIAKLNEQLILARAETAQARAAYEQLQAAVNRGGDVTSFADSAQAEAIGALRIKASDLRRELAEIRPKYGSRHPTVVALQAQLSDVTNQIQRETNRTISSARNLYEVAKSREASIEASLDELKGVATATSRAEITLRELERDATANRALYESFLSKFKETSQQETLKTSTARIIERAEVPTIPSAPNKKRITLLWVVFGLIGGAGLAYLLERLDTGFRSVRDVEQLLGVPVLANIPNADSEVKGKPARALPYFNIVRRIRKARGDEGSAPNQSGNRRAAISRLVVEKPLAAFTEAIRALRMGIRFAGVDARRKVILVTSALPAEGKSTVASNLAQQAALSGERVVLIDMDIRRPALTEIYVPNAKRGIIDVVLGEVELKSVILEDKETGLNFIPAPHRQGVSYTAEMLGSVRTKEILNQLSDLYDLVVIDSSPLLPVTDGRALIDSVDGLILVVKWEKTQRDAIVSALHGCFGIEGKLIGVALNDVIPSRARYEGYYQSGYYMGKYPEYLEGKT